MSVFSPSNSGLGASISATNVSSRAAIVGTGDTLIIANKGTGDVHIAFGSSTVTATTAHYVIFAATKEEFLFGKDVAAEATHVAAITAGSATGTVVINRGTR
jgi:hypothetical protein